jgi:hypothetical protein
VGGREGSRGLTSVELEASIRVRNAGLLSTPVKVAAMDETQQRCDAGISAAGPRLRSWQSSAPQRSGRERQTSQKAFVPSWSSR